MATTGIATQHGSVGGRDGIPGKRAMRRSTYDSKSTSIPLPKVRSSQGVISAAKRKHDLLRIHVFINGEALIPKREVLFDFKKAPTFDYFLDYCTNLLKPTFGVIRKLVSLDTMKVVNSKEDLMENADYIAVGSSPVKRIQYGQKLKTGPSSTAIINKKLQRVQSKAFNIKPSFNPYTIRLVLNGDSSGDFQVFPVIAKDVPSWEKFLDRVTEKLTLGLRHGDVKKIYTLTGNEVSSINQLQPDDVYVCADRPPFVRPGVKLTSKGLLVRSGSIIKAQQEKQNATRKKKKAALIKGGTHDNNLAQAGYNLLIQEEVEDVLAEVLEQTISHMSRVRKSLLGEPVLDLTRQKKGKKKKSPNSVNREFDHYIDHIIGYMMQGSDDQEFLDRAPSIMEAAAAGSLVHWEQDSRGFIALVIVLDQFPRSMYTDANRYLLDPLACDVVLRSIHETKVIDTVELVLRLFPCFALTHQESLEMQQLCLDQWQKVSSLFKDNDPIWKTIQEFQKNFEIIKRFGRFPQRNEVLGRVSSQEEVRYLLNSGHLPKVKQEANKSKKLSRMSFARLSKKVFFKRSSNATVS